MRHIAKTVTGMPATDGAGVKLKRVIGSPALDSIDPFLMEHLERVFARRG